MAKRRPPNPLQPLLDKLPAPMKDKYVVTLVIFLFIIFFVNRINPLAQWSLQRHKTELEGKKRYYEQKLETVQQDRWDSRRDVEKFAREKYYMQQRDEEVFIIKEEEENQR